ncbi:MAG TPA: hypothetical protein PLQ35_15240 [bacterium]|nr:hypothetical protein [bacterium]HQL63638.1 hypothetical protein [bacterium]
MIEVAEKDELLKNGGFMYNFHREIYFNRKTKKIFSIEAIEDHDKKWLQRCGMCQVQ